MKANDFPSLPGVPDPAPNTEPARFLDVVKGTSKMKLDDDQDTLPDDFIADEVEPEPAVEQDSVSVSPKPRSKNSSVSESQTVTPVVSVERPLSPPSDGLVSPPLVNGDAGPGKVSKSVPVVSINTNNDRDSGSVSPRQQSLVSVSAPCTRSSLISFLQELSGQKLTYAQIMKKKQEKEAKEAAERAAQEAAEEKEGEGGGKGKSEDKVTPPAPVQETETKKEETAPAPPGPRGEKGRLSKTNSGPSSGDKDKKLAGSANNNNNNKAANKRTERPKSPVGGGPAK